MLPIKYFVSCFANVESVVYAVKEAEPHPSVCIAAKKKLINKIIKERKKKQHRNARSSIHVLPRWRDQHGSTASRCIVFLAGSRRSGRPFSTNYTRRVSIRIRCVWRESKGRGSNWMKIERVRRTIIRSFEIWKVTLGTDRTWFEIETTFRCLPWKDLECCKLILKFEVTRILCFQDFLKSRDEPKDS